jgi:hypothetical protein
VLVGVGNNPDPVPPVRGAEGGGWYTVPDSIIPERGKVSENGSHPETKQAWDVLHDDEPWSYLANKSPVFSPQTRPFTFKASALSSMAKVLAGEAATDCVNGNSVSLQNVC